LAESETRRERPTLAPGALQFLPLAVGLAIILAGVWLLQGEALRDLAAGLGRGPGGPRVGAPAPDFTLQGLDGNQVRLADLRGQKVVVNFWATWCPPCRSEMPDLDRVARESRGEGVVVLAVDQMESPDTVRGYLRELSLGLDPVLDEHGDVAQLYRVNALPTSFFIDASGVVREVHVGPLSRATILAKLAAMR